jgi:8-oxo-dGTP diphosphatase
MKTIEVVAAIIKYNDRILATQRGYGEFAGGWEFPGGKMEAGETQEQALIREIKEELEADIEILKYVETVEYDYPNFHLILHCYLCTIISGDFVLKEHNSAKWLRRDELKSVEWLPADKGLIERMYLGYYENIY